MVTLGIKLFALGVGVIIAGTIPALSAVRILVLTANTDMTDIGVATLGKFILAAGLILIVVGVVQSIAARRRNGGAH